MFQLLTGQRDQSEVKARSGGDDFQSSPVLCEDPASMMPKRERFGNHPTDPLWHDLWIFAKQEFGYERG
jgi:hypothetical protein